MECMDELIDEDHLLLTVVVVVRDLEETWEEGKRAQKEWKRVII